MSVEIDVPILSRPFQRSAFLDLGRAHAGSGVVDQVQCGISSQAGVRHMGPL